MKIWIIIILILILNNYIYSNVKIIKSEDDNYIIVFNNKIIKKNKYEQIFWEKYFDIETGYNIDYLTKTKDERYVIIQNKENYNYPQGITYESVIIIFDKDGNVLKTQYLKNNIMGHSIFEGVNNDFIFLIFDYNLNKYFLISLDYNLNIAWLKNLGISLKMHIINVDSNGIQLLIHNQPYYDENKFMILNYDNYGNLISYEYFSPCYPQVKIEKVIVVDDGYIAIQKISTGSYSNKCLITYIKNNNEKCCFEIEQKSKSIVDVDAKSIGNDKIAIIYNDMSYCLGACDMFFGIIEIDKNCNIIKDKYYYYFWFGDFINFDGDNYIVVIDHYSIQDVLYLYNSYTPTPTLEQNPIPTPVDNYISNKIILYPNPFNPLKSELKFLNVPLDSIIVITNLTGEYINSFYYNQNDMKIKWNGKNLKNNLVSSGIYFVLIKNKNNIIFKNKIFVYY